MPRRPRTSKRRSPAGASTPGDFPVRSVPRLSQGNIRPDLIAVDRGGLATSIRQALPCRPHSRMPLPPSRFDSTMPPRHARKPASRLKSPKTSPTAEPRLSRTRRPANLQVADWQTVLRRQFGREQRFELENLGSHPVFSDFRVHNPEAEAHYRVAIRGADPGRISAPARILRPTTWAPASTSSSRSPRWKRSAAARRHWRAASIRRSARSGSTTRACVRLRFRAGTDCPSAVLARRGRCSIPAPTGCCRGKATRTGAPAARCPRVRPRAAMPRRRLAVHRPDPRRRAPRCAPWPRRIPRAAKDRASSRLLKVTLYPYQAEGALFAARAGRC